MRQSEGLVPARAREVSTAVTEYNRSQFLRALGDRGFNRTGRWHEEWIELGLLAPGGRRTSARGHLSYVWPHSQLELACALLPHVQKGVVLGSLTNIVVLIWLWYGDEFIPFQQVPRSLKTWRLAESRPAEKHVRAAAREFVTKIAHPKGTGRRALVNKLIDATYQGGARIESVRELFDNVFDPDGRGRPRGPKGAELTTDLYMKMVRLRSLALVALPTFSEMEFHKARTLYLHSRLEYAQAQPQFAKDSDLGRAYELPDLNDLVNSACSDLLTCVAMVRGLGREAGNGFGASRHQV